MIEGGEREGRIKGERNEERKGENKIRQEKIRNERRKMKKE